MKWLTCLVAAFSALANSSHAMEIRIANWNIQTLTYPGDPVTVFPGDYKRTDTDFTDLRQWRDMVGADVFFLQEVTSPAAIDSVFPARQGWTHCVSGQYSGGEPVTAKPICTAAGAVADMPSGPHRAQYTAVAIRPGSPVHIASIADVPSLNVKSKDNGQVRDVRWGLDVTLIAGDLNLRTLVVHLKSGCFDDFINRTNWEVDPETTEPTGPACSTLGRQMYPLRKWIEERESVGDKWMIVGDFNRRLDAGSGTYQDEIWQALSGYSPRADGVDRDGRKDINLYRAPYKTPSVCWKDFVNASASLADADNYNMLPIEFFVYGQSAKAVVVDGSEQQVAWPNPQPQDSKRLSDHCPASLRLQFN